MTTSYTLAYRSYKTGYETAYGGATTITIDKPTGLTAGDLMIAHISTPDSTTIPSKTGWTIPTNGSASNGNKGTTAILYKIASAADAAASDFVFTVGGDSIGAISVFYNQLPSYEVYAVTSKTGTGANLTFNSITPHREGSFVMWFCSNVSYAAPAAFSGYAINTSNPASITEVYDYTPVTDVDAKIAMAYASRPEATATDGGSVTMSTEQYYIIFMCFITSKFNYAGNDCGNSFSTRKYCKRK